MMTGPMVGKQNAYLKKLVGQYNMPPTSGMFEVKII